MAELIEKFLRPKKFCELIGIAPNNATIIKKNNLAVVADDGKLWDTAETMRRILQSSYFKKHHAHIKSLLLRGQPPEPKPKAKKIKNDSSPLGPPKESSDEIILHWRKFFRDISANSEDVDEMLRKGIDTCSSIIDSCGEVENAHLLKSATGSLRDLVFLRKENGNVITLQESMMILGYANEIIITGMRDIIIKFCVDNNLNVDAQNNFQEDLARLVDNIRKTLPEKMNDIRKG